MRSNFEGYHVRLSDVARVLDSFEERKTAIRFNGKPAIVLQILKKKSADIMDVIREIKKVASQHVSSGFHVDFFNDQAEETRDKLSLVSGNALIGFILVMAVLFLLMDFRTAFWTAAGLPVVLCFAAIFLYLADVSINSVSLTGLIVVLGMLVDDAIVVAENIFRKKREGIAGIDAAFAGVKEVAKPVTATVVTTVAVFIPLLFIPGMIGDFAFEIPLVIGFTLMASLFESFFFLPGHLSHNSGKVVRERKVFIVLHRWYLRFMPTLLRRRYVVLLGFIVLVVLVGWLAVRSLQVVLFDSDNNQAYRFYIYGRTADGSSLQHTVTIVKKIENALQKIPKKSIRSWKSQVGIGLWDSDADCSDFAISVRMPRSGKRMITASQAVAMLRKKISDISGIARIGYWVDAGGPPAGRQFEIAISGGNKKARQLVTQRLIDLLKRPETVKNRAI